MNWSHIARVFAIAAIALAFFGGLGLAANPWNLGVTANPSSDVSSPNAPAANDSSSASPTPALNTTGIATMGNPSAGAHIVMMKCAGCHGEDGSGHGVELIDMNPKQPPIPWTDKAAMAQLNDQQLASKISQSDKKRDPDSVMPAFGDQLTSQQITDVVAYIRSLAQ